MQVRTSSWWISLFEMAIYPGNFTFITSDILSVRDLREMNVYVLTRMGVVLDLVRIVYYPWAVCGEQGCREHTVRAGLTHDVSR